MTPPLLTPSTSSGLAAPPGLLGSTTPRLWTPPLRELTPATSYGFDVIDFAEEIGRPLDPWQQWLVIHGGELLADGRPRFRIVLVLVARQNGKTHLLVVLSLYWLFVELRELVLGTSSKVEYAKEPWEKALGIARSVPWLSRRIGRVRRVNGEQEMPLTEGVRYKIAAANDDAGRSLTVHRLILDELRRHTSWAAYNAAIPTMNAVWDAQAWALSNQGGDEAIVLHSLRESALHHLQYGDGDDTLGIFEWSMPYDEDGGALPDPTDLAALAQANPQLGRRNPVDTLLAQARRAKAAGGEELTGFLTEIGCVRVKHLTPALPPELWEACREDGDLSGVRDRVALCLDVSLDQLHACVVAAAVLPDGRVRVEPVAAWSGPTATAELRRELLPLVRRVRPRTLGWFPGGPAAAVAAEIYRPRERPSAAGEEQPPAPSRRTAPGWPRAVAVEPIRADATAACMGLVDLVTARQLAHAGDPMLTAHVLGAEKLRQGDAWRFARRGGGHCDGAYAAAGAAHLARTLPPPPPRPRVVTSRRAREARERAAAAGAPTDSRT